MTLITYSDFFAILIDIQIKSRMAKKATENFIY